MTTIRYQIEMRAYGEDWQFHMSAPQMTEPQAREITTDWNVKRRRSGEFRAVRVTETREVLEDAQARPDRRENADALL